MPMVGFCSLTSSRRRAPFPPCLPSSTSSSPMAASASSIRTGAPIFVPDFNRRFTVKPSERGSAFVPLAGLDVELLLSIQHERIVNKDNTVSFKNLALQLPMTDHRLHFVRCPVMVHELLDYTLAVSHLGRVIARFDPTSGDLLPHRQGDDIHRSAA